MDHCDRGPMSCASGQTMMGRCRSASRKLSILSGNGTGKSHIRWSSVEIPENHQPINVYSPHTTNPLTCVAPCFIALREAKQSIKLLEMVDRELYFPFLCFLSQPRRCNDCRSTTAYYMG